MELIYEDGLRLSELYGQLAGAEFALDHLLTTYSFAFIAMGVLGVPICAFLYTCLNEKIGYIARRTLEFKEEADRPKDTWLYTWKIKPIYGWNDEQTRYYNAIEQIRPWVKCVPFVVCCIVLILIEVGTFIIVQDCATKDVIQIQAQIDAILSKYQ